jgi:hypothetical protein
MAEDMHQVLSLDDKGASSALNAPSKLFRSILADLNIDRQAWDKLMRQFINNPKNGVPNTPSKRSSERSNLNRALSKDRITWRTFRKAIQLLNPKDCTYELELVWDKRMTLPNEPPTAITHIPQNRQDELFTMFGRILTDIGSTPKLWGRLVDRYLDRQNDSVSRNPPDRSTERGNIGKAIMGKHEYTWETFVKGLSIVGVRRATLTINLNWGRKTTCHSYTFKTDA